MSFAAPSGFGKTKAFREVAARTGARLINLNLELSRRMLDLTESQRALRLPGLLDDVVGRDEPLVLLDNIEILFDAALKQDPLRLLPKCVAGTLLSSRPGMAHWRTGT